MPLATLTPREVTSGARLELNYGLALNTRSKLDHCMRGQTSRGWHQPCLQRIERSHRQLQVLTAASA
jgi:hypothetical protein